MKKIKSAVLKFEDGSMEIISNAMIFQCNMVNEKRCGMRVRTVNLKNGDRLNYLMGLMQFVEDEVQKIVETDEESEE